jgi:DNA-binding transcriptional LysR family regulator
VVVELDLRLLRYFVAVADVGSFSGAAQVVHVSQPALSQGIRRLEAAVGTRLIERGRRGSKGVALTAAGRVLYPEATDLLARSERAVLRTRSSVERVRVRLGFGTNTPRALTGRALEVAQGFPHIDLTLQHVVWGEEQGTLLRGAVDLLYIQLPEGFSHPELDLATLLTVRRVAVFPRHHRLATRPVITMSDLRDEPILDAATDRNFWLVDPRPGYPLPRVVGPAATTVEEMLAFVSAGLAMAITSESVADKHGDRELVFIPIGDLEPAVIALARLRSDTRPGLLGLYRLLSSDTTDPRPDTSDPSTGQE